RRLGQERRAAEAASPLRQACAERLTQCKAPQIWTRAPSRWADSQAGRRPTVASNTPIIERFSLGRVFAQDGLRSGTCRPRVTGDGRGDRVFEVLHAPHHPRVVVARFVSWPRAIAIVTERWQRSAHSLAFLPRQMGFSGGVSDALRAQPPASAPRRDQG